MRAVHAACQDGRRQDKVRSLFFVLFYFVILYCILGMTKCAKKTSDADRGQEEDLTSLYVLEIPILKR